MEPVGPLMIEHRLIERMIDLLKREHSRLSKDNRVNARFIDHAVDFIRTYADRCHHGKEEDILFKQLTEKQLSPEHLSIMEELVKEHAHARTLTNALAEANERYVDGEERAMFEIKIKLEELIAFYPPHIEKEDKHFFLPCMKYFSDDEKRDMLEQFIEADRKIIHETYDKLVKKLEKE